MAMLVLYGVVVGIFDDTQNTTTHSSYKTFCSEGSANLKLSKKKQSPVPKLSSPQKEHLPESIRFPKNLQPAGVSYIATFMALATL